MRTSPGRLPKMTTRALPGCPVALPVAARHRHSVHWLGVPALRPGFATDNSYGAAPHCQAHEGYPLPGPWLSAATLAWHP